LERRLCADATSCIAIPLHHPGLVSLRNTYLWRQEPVIAQPGLADWMRVERSKDFDLIGRTSAC
jgi:hypothetical protein